MAKVPLKNLAGEDIGSVSVSDSVFAAPINQVMVHQAVVRQLANARLGTHKTKTRGAVSGGGAKPWRQKGTGRARQGSRVSPLWRGGGIVFGPVPRSYRQAMPKRMRRSAMRSGLSARLGEGAMIAIDSFVVAEIRTREMADSLTKLGLHGTITVIDEHFDEKAYLSARNLSGVDFVDSGSLSIVDVLRPDHLVFTKTALELLDKRLATEVK